MNNNSILRVGDLSDTIIALNYASIIMSSKPLFNENVSAILVRNSVKREHKEIIRNERANAQ